MAEVCIQSASPLQDAIAWLTSDSQRGWTFVEWRPALQHPLLTAGMRGVLDGGVPFTVRHDWDASKLYHVNAQKGAERRAYIKTYQAQEFDTERDALMRYQTLTRRIQNSGDQDAQEWLMSGCEPPELNLNFET